LQVTEQFRDSSPLDVQLRVQGPGSQVGVQIGPECSHWKLQLVPEQLMLHSSRPVHPERHT